MSGPNKGAIMTIPVGRVAAKMGDNFAVTKKGSISGAFHHQKSGQSISHGVCVMSLHRAPPQCPSTHTGMLQGARQACCTNTPGLDTGHLCWPPLVISPSFAPLTTAWTRHRDPNPSWQTISDKLLHFLANIYGSAWECGWLCAQSIWTGARHVHTIYRPTVCCSLGQCDLLVCALGLVQWHPKCPDSEAYQQTVSYYGRGATRFLVQIATV